MAKKAFSAEEIVDLVIDRGYGTTDKIVGHICNLPEFDSDDCGGLYDGHKEIAVAREYLLKALPQIAEVKVITDRYVAQWKDYNDESKAHDYIAERQALHRALEETVKQVAAVIGDTVEIDQTEYGPENYIRNVEAHGVGIKPKMPPEKGWEVK